MEVDITYGTKEDNGFWFATINDDIIHPGFGSQKIAKAFAKWLSDGAFVDIMKAHDKIVDVAFKKMNDGR